MGQAELCNGRGASGRARRGEEWPSGCSLHPPPPQLRSGEKIKLIPLLCIVCTSVVWGFALFFFFQGLSTWQVSGPPAGAGSQSPTGSSGVAGRPAAALHFPAAFVFSPPASEPAWRPLCLWAAEARGPGTCPGMRSGERLSSASRAPAMGQASVL